MGQKVILPIIFSIIIFSGATSAFAQMSAPPPPQGPLPGTVPGFEDNYLHACWLNPIGQDTPPNCVPNGVPNYYGASSQGFDFHSQAPVANCDVPGQLGFCTIQLPNWIDELPYKDIKIVVNYAGEPPSNPNVTCFDPLFPNGVAGALVDTNTIPDQQVMWTFECEPNPNWEEIVFQIGDTNIFDIVVWTTSYDIPVGGIGLPVDSVSLLLASAQSISLWMIPVIAAIGIGAFVIKRKF